MIKVYILAFILYGNCVFSVVKAKKKNILTSVALETCIKYFTFYKFRLLVFGLGLVHPPLQTYIEIVRKKRVIFWNIQ